MNMQKSYDGSRSERTADDAESHAGLDLSGGFGGFEPPGKLADPPVKVGKTHWGVLKAEY